MFLVVLLPWWFSYYRPPGYPWEWGQLQDERWDYLWLFGVCIQVGRSPGAVVCFMFSNFFWVRPTGDIPSWADLWGRSLFLPYVRLFPGLYFILGLVFLSFIFMIKGEQSKSIAKLNEKESERCYICFTHDPRIKASPFPWSFYYISNPQAMAEMIFNLNFGQASMYFA